MKKLTLLLSIITCFSLSGCFERENPLKTLDSGDVSDWLYKNKNPQMIVCAKIWENQSKADSTSLNNCKETRSEIAGLLTGAGFGKILPEDVVFPTVWQKFNQQITRDNRNSYDPEAAGKAMQLAPSGSLGNRIEEYKKQREQSNN